MSTPEPDFNPFASPTAEEALLKPEAERSDMELVRYEHLKHEASIRSVGIFYYIPAVLFGLSAPAMLFMGLTNDLPEEGGLSATFCLVIGIVDLLLTSLFFWIGYGLRQLNRSVRIPVIVLSALGLLSGLLTAGVGTIINGYILYHVVSPKGNTILSPEYQEIRRATPHIKYKSSFIVLLVIGLLIVFAIVVIVAIWGG